MTSNSACPDIRGWILDLYPTDSGMILWIATETGERMPVFAPFAPSFFLEGSPRNLERAVLRLNRMNLSFSRRWSEKRDFMSGQPKTVLEISIRNPLAFPEAVFQLTRHEEQIAFYNCDIALPQMFFYENDLFPLALCDLSLDGSATVQRIVRQDSLWNTHYRLPDLRLLRIRSEGITDNPRHAPPSSLEIETEDGVRVLDGEDPRSLLRTLNRHLAEEDPDLILSEWGDDWIFPGLEQLSRATGIPLALNRAPGRPMKGQKERSWFSYGRIHFRAGSFLLSGRWHIDRKNSFILGEAELDGLFEQARVTRIPVQTMARTSTGTGITSMQLEQAIREGILIPWRKSEPESFRSSLDLLGSDKGGMTFLPPPGFHESVAELDFASMYPAIMTRFNISPETVGCTCCPDNRAPETRHTLCTRRKGLVPRVLEPILSKRQSYKEQLAQLPENLRKDHPFNRRQKALKWLLVVSFGYLGYKNARFGRIEAHECVTAYSREILLAAKELSEERGFRLLHGIVDSLWLQKPGITDEECRELAREIGERTGIPLNLEGLYRWIQFFPSRARPSLSVPNRYLGVFRSGEIKVRGLEARRSDTPPLIRKIQKEVIDLLSNATTLEEYRLLLPRATELFKDRLSEIREGRVPLRELAIRRRLTKTPEEYGRSTLSGIVAHELAGRGIRLHAGETIRYIITSARDRDPLSRAKAYPLASPDATYDREKYAELLHRAIEPLLNPLDPHRIP